jgi:glycosyltransferase involved in cell wall biosynthesis
MNSLAALLAGVSLAFSATTIGADAIMRSEVYNYGDHLQQPPPTTIIVPTLNEEAYLSETLASLENQNVRRRYPEKFETIIVDGGSRDRTAAIAKNFGCRLIIAPRGKLNARHEATLKAKGKIMVGVDADTYYPPNYLNLTLKAFNQPGVVGVASPRLYGRDSNMVVNTAGLWKAILDGMMGERMPGSNSAYLKSAYMQVGGFNLGIDQFNNADIMQEEEYEFPRRLREVGKVVWLWKVPAYTSARRLTTPTPETRSFKSHNDNYILLYPLLEI